MKKYQLSHPGPTEYHPDVLKQLAKPNFIHYGDIWMKFYRELLVRLKRVFQTRGSVFILPSSGSGGIDAVFTSLGSKRGLVLSNGFFGDRLATIARRHSDRLTILTKNPGSSFSVDEVEDMCNKNDFEFLALVHGETSTGMLNSISDFSNICRKKDLLYIVDAVSTLGGAPLSVEKQGVDFCISASQKALGSLPGLAVISVSQKGWSRIPPENEIQSWYLNLRTWAFYEKEWGGWHPYPVTLPVHIYYALNKALELILEEGLEKRWDRHKKVSKKLQNELRKLGISPFIEKKNARMPTVTAGVLPDSLSSERLLEFLKDNYGIIIAGGVGPLRKRIFRIGHMGYSAQDWLVNRVLAGIKDFLEK